MLRHGRTEANERRVFTGATDIGLSAGGAQALAERRHTYPQGVLYFTSGMRRADETLAILYGDVPHTPIPALAEYRFGDFEGRGHDDLFESESVYRLWLDRTSVDVACPGGETRRAFDARVREGWAMLTAQPWNGLAVLVAHGGVLSALMRGLFPQEADAVVSPGNGAGWIVTLDEEGRAVAQEAFP